jgi:hypothetical protein
MFDSLERFMLIAGRKERAGTPVSVCDHCERTYPEEWVFNNICPFCGEEHTNTDGATGYRPQPEVELDCDGYPTDKANWDMKIHPLSLLTSSGNGRGGGDYHYPEGDFMDPDGKPVVGSWAGDIISVERRKKQIAGYAKLTPNFTEYWRE